MTNTEILQAGVNLLLVGVGFVMLFLVILIYAIGLMSYIINRFFPEPISIPPSSAVPQPTDELVQLRPVIVAAIAYHRRQQRLKQSGEQL